MDVNGVLANIWFWLLGLILVLYVVLDGFDLGVGVLSLFSRQENRRRNMMASLSSTWDANETWLIIFGGALFGAFPLAYAVVLHALYIPIIVMVIGLIFRSASFEFRGHSKNVRVWETSFGIGSLIAATCQGFIIGTALRGIPVNSAGTYTGGAFLWARPFCIATIVGVIAGYMMLGATYLIIRTAGAEQHKQRIWAAIAASFSFMGAIASMIIIPFINSPLAEKWTSGSLQAWLFVFFGFAALSFVLLLFSLWRGYVNAPFVFALAVFLFTAIDLGLTLNPYIVPTSVTIYEAASSPVTLVFMLTGIGMLIPIIMVYNGYVYLVFRGKVSQKGGYGSD